MLWVAFCTFVLPVVLGAALGRLLSEPGRQRFWLWSILAAYAAGYLGVFGLPPFPPLDSQDRLMVVMLGAGFLWVIFPQQKLEIRILLLVSAVAFVMQAFSLIQHTWDVVETGLQLVLYLAITAGLALVFDLISQRLSASWHLLYVSVYLGFSGLILSLGGSASLGQNAGIYALAIGGAWLGSFAKWDSIPIRLFNISTVVVFVGFVFNGYHYAELKWSPMLLMFLAPVAACVIVSQFCPASQVIRGRQMIAGITFILLIAALVVSWRLSEPIAY
jgi:hypothetical protein